MATRRMFSKTVTNSSDFLMMSQSAQNLYFHFGMNADDDGFCEVFTIMRMTDSKPDDLRSLHEKGFLFVIDSKVCLIKDWHENNQLRIDRYKRSQYLSDPKFEELYAIVMEEKINEIQQYQPLLKKWQPNGNQMVPQARLGESSLEEVSIGKVSKKSIDETKVSHGEFSKVKLSNEEYGKLVERMGENNVSLLIAELDQYIASKGKKYSSHYATILAWARRRVEDHQKKTTKVVKL